MAIEIETDVSAGGALTGVEKLLGWLGTDLHEWTPAQVRDFVMLGAIALSAIDTDGTLAANSDARIASQKAVRTYIAAMVTGTYKFQTTLDCSGNLNYPAASKGFAWVVSVAGKVGGASGVPVDIGDTIVAIADNAGGTHGAVGASWDVLEHNLIGALLAANNLSDLASPATARTNLGLAIGTNVQAFSLILAFLAGAASADAAGVRALISAEQLGQLAGIDTQTGSYTLVLGDIGKVVEMNVGSANNLTVPPNSSVAFLIGARIDLLQLGAGQTTVVAGAGVTIRSASGALKLNAQYSGASLYKRGTDEWVLLGDITT